MIFSEVLCIVQNLYNERGNRWCLVLYLASVEALEEDHSHRPDVHLVGDFRWLLPHHKTLWRKVPEKHTPTQ